MKHAKAKKVFLIPLFLGILIGAVGIVRFFYSGLMDKVRYESVKGIGVALAVYADEYEILPPFGKWCDKLIEKADCTPLMFQGVIDREEGVCGYAINANLDGKKLSALDKKVVLAFEAKGPWNLQGGPELMKSKQKKIAVVFVDGNMNFVKPEDIDKLKWNP